MILLSILSLMLLIGGVFIFFLPQNGAIARAYSAESSEVGQLLEAHWFFVTTKFAAVILCFLGFIAFVQAWGVYRQQQIKSIRTAVQGSVVFKLKETKLTATNTTNSEIKIDLGNCSNTTMTYLLYPELTPKDYSKLKVFGAEVRLPPSSSQSFDVQCSNGLCSNADTYITCSKATTYLEEKAVNLGEIQFPLIVGSAGDK